MKRIALVPVTLIIQHRVNCRRNCVQSTRRRSIIEQNRYYQILIYLSPFRRYLCHSLVILPITLVDRLWVENYTGESHIRINSRGPLHMPYYSELITAGNWSSVPWLSFDFF